MIKQETKLWFDQAKEHYFVYTNKDKAKPTLDKMREIFLWLSKKLNQP